MSSAVFIVLLGPGDRELTRFRHLMDSLIRFERGLVEASTLVIVDDCGGDILAKVQGRYLKFNEIRVVRNPYAAASGGVILYDRLLAGVLSALQQTLAFSDCDFVLKIDTDALVIRPFSDRLKAFLSSNPRIGMVGSFRRDPDGKLRKSEAWWERQIRKTCGHFPSDLLRLHIKHGVPMSPVRMIRRWLRRREWIKAALKNGWGWGDNILGGAYALSPLMLRALHRERELISDVMLFEGTRIPDDPGVSILTAALGFQLGEFNQDGEVFGVWYQQPTLSAETLVARGYGLVHSIKASDPIEEDALRESVYRAAGI